MMSSQMSPVTFRVSGFTENLSLKDLETPDKINMNNKRQSAMSVASSISPIKNQIPNNAYSPDTK